MLGVGSVSKCHRGRRVQGHPDLLSPLLYSPFRHVAELVHELQQVHDCQDLEHHFHSLLGSTHLDQPWSQIHPTQTLHLPSGLVALALQQASIL